MAIGLKELERRTNARSGAASLRGSRSGTSAFAYSRPTRIRPARVPFSHMSGGHSAAAGDAALIAKLVAGGIAQAEAEKIAADVAQFDAASSQPTMASAHGLSLPTTNELTGLVKNAALNALAASIFGPTGPLAVQALFLLCDELNACVAFGIGVTGGSIGGAGGAGGIVFAPDRRVGVYGSLGLVLGEILDVSVGVQVTFVLGGLANFNGRSYTIGGAIGEGLGISGHFILGAQAQPIGLMGELDLRGGAPVRVIAGAWETRSVTTQFSHQNGSRWRGDPIAIAYDKRDEASFNTLAGVPVHYDRLKAPKGYGSKGEQRNFKCTNELKTALGNCMTDLFAAWNEGNPTIILSAGTLGDGEHAHGKGNAFDLDGFWWGERRFMMDEYPTNRRLYIGINAHLFLYFPQVLSYHYKGHKDHFHVDFNQSHKNHFRTGSEAQTYFLQMVLKYLYGQDLGTSGKEKDGVDGDYGTKTKNALKAVLPMIDMAGKDITKQADWREFLTKVRENAFRGQPVEQVPLPGQAVPLP